MYKCQFCPCEFASESDLDRHLEAFGRRGHLQKFQKLHEDAENDYNNLHGGADRIVWEIARIVKRSTD